ncbi:type II toxin-antitoxin system VapC family toxin [Candidatus Rariloculus sp.]|uniref:type II toxin-antitoxin system VapC family toxin n=1 Tax=Candidatus Rariloculus sp. TaxID=3101265 RepID=UPI003D0B5A1D
MTVLLDTNVMSELIRKSPDTAVEAWAAGHPLEDLFFSAVGEAELRYGAAILPTGRRRESLVSDIERMLHDAFENRVLPFDTEAARSYADIAAMRRSAGRPVTPADCQIAAIAHSRNMAVATRNVRDFEDIDIEVVDPWAAA